MIAAAESVWSSGLVLAAAAALAAAAEVVAWVRRR